MKKKKKKKKKKRWMSYQPGQIYNSDTPHKQKLRHN